MYLPVGTCTSVAAVASGVIRDARALFQRRHHELYAFAQLCRAAFPIVLGSTSWLQYTVPVPGSTVGTAVLYLPVLGPGDGVYLASLVY